MCVLIVSLNGDRDLIMRIGLTEIHVMIILNSVLILLLSLSLRCFTKQDIAFEIVQYLWFYKYSNQKIIPFYVGI